MTCGTVAWTIAAIPAGWLAAIVLMWIVEIVKHGWRNDR